MSDERASSRFRPLNVHFELVSGRNRVSSQKNAISNRCVRRRGRQDSDNAPLASRTLWAPRGSCGGIRLRLHAVPGGATCSFRRAWTLVWAAGAGTHVTRLRHRCCCSCCKIVAQKPMLRHYVHLGRRSAIMVRHPFGCFRLWQRTPRAEEVYVQKLCSLVPAQRWGL